MGSYEEGGGRGLCFKAGVSWKSRWPEEYLRTDRQTDSAVTHKVESTTNSTGGCSVSYFMDECTVGFGDHATLRPPATALLHPGIKETGEHTSPFGQRPPERLSLPPQALCFLTGQLGKHHGSSPAFESEEMSGAGCVGLGATPAGGLGEDSRREARWTGMGRGSQGSQYE